MTQKNETLKEKIKKLNVEDYKDAEYDITQEGYEKAFILMLEGNFNDAIKLLSFARKRLRGEITDRNRMGFPVEIGDFHTSEKAKSIYEIITALKEKNLKEAINSWGMGLGMPFEGLMAKEEFDVEIDGIRRNEKQKTADWIKQDLKKKFGFDDMDGNFLMATEGHLNEYFDIELKKEFSK